MIQCFNGSMAQCPNRGLGRSGQVLLRQVRHGGKRLRIVHSQCRQDLPVKRDLGLAQAMDQSAIAEPVEPGSGVNTHGPQPAEQPFLGSAIAVGIHQATLDCLSRLAVLPTAPASESLGQLEDFFPAPPRFESAFCSWHGNVSLWPTGKGSYV